MRLLWVRIEVQHFFGGPHERGQSQAEDKMLGLENQRGSTLF
jgi:hypothetical protein